MHTNICYSKFKRTIVRWLFSLIRESSMTGALFVVYPDILAKKNEANFRNGALQRRRLFYFRALRIYGTVVRHSASDVEDTPTD